MITILTIIYLAHAGTIPVSAGWIIGGVMVVEGVQVRSAYEAAEVARQPVGTEGTVGTTVHR